MKTPKKKTPAHPTSSSKKLKATDPAKQKAEPAGEHADSIKDDPKPADAIYFFPVTEELRKQAGVLDNILTVYIVLLDRAGISCAQIGGKLDLTVFIECAYPYQAAEMIERVYGKQTESGPNTCIIDDGYFSDRAVRMSAGVCVPLCFSELIRSLSITPLVPHKIGETLLKDVRIYVSIFNGIDIKKIVFPKNPFLKGDCIKEVLALLLPFLKVISETATREEPLPKTIVKISKGQDKSLTFCVNGQIKKNKKTRQALAALSFFEDREFDVRQFTAYYNADFSGGVLPKLSGSAGRDLDNRKPDLPELVRGLKATPPNLRQWRGVYFDHPHVTKEDLKAFLREQNIK